MSTVTAPSVRRSMRRTTAFSTTRGPSSSAIRSAICWVPPGKRSCWAPPSTSSMRSETARRLDVAHRVQHRHLVGLASPGHPRHDRHQVPRRRRRRASTAATRRATWRRGARRFGAVHGCVHRHLPADAVEPPLDPGHVEQLDDRQLRNGAAVGPHPAAPADQVLAAAVGRHRLAAQLGGQREHGVLCRADERSAEVDGCAGDRRRRRPAADTVAPFENHDVVAASHQLAGRRQAREPGSHDDDVGVRLGWSRD